jgi:riboflavin synthase
MFTGIIEALGTVESLDHQDENLLIRVRSPLAPELKVDQSLSHQGVCLTVTAVTAGVHQVVAVRETLTKSNLGALRAGDLLNLERALLVGGRLDGHLVQGHVDATGSCVSRTPDEGSTLFRFRFPGAFRALVIEKGSIALNGVSLTVFSVTDEEFSVAVIPYTLEHTTLGRLQPGDSVNLEFDLVGKYITRLRQTGAPA